VDKLRWFVKVLLMLELACCKAGRGGGGDSRCGSCGSCCGGCGSCGSSEGCCCSDGWVACSTVKAVVML